MAKITLRFNGTKYDIDKVSKDEIEGLYYHSRNNDAISFEKASEIANFVFLWHLKKSHEAVLETLAELSDMGRK